MAAWFEPFHVETLSDEQRDRLVHHAAYWGEVARNTEPLDRDCAATAISRLYTLSRRRLSPPRFEWAASPLAGLLMAVEANKGGGSRPAGKWLSHELEPDREWFRHHRRRMGDDGWMAGVNGRQFVRELGLDGSLTLRRSIVAGTAAALRDRFAGWEYDRHDRMRGDTKRTARLDTAGKAIYADDWDFVARYVDRERLIDRFDSQFRDFLSSEVDDHIGHMAMVFRTMYFREGQFDSIFPAAAMWTDVLGRRAANRDQIEPWLDVARACGPWWSYEDLAIVIDRPLAIRTDQRGRPHCEDGPAIAYSDGFEVWAHHGVCVPKWVITQPERLSVASIDRETNAEIRRVMVERFGVERLVREGQARLLDESEAGRLWQRRMGPDGPRWWGGEVEEHIVMVEVQNSTPEPDGTVKTYFLRVPPTIKTAQEAVAWTFALRETQYEPLVET